jgi:hypothetical protein
MPVAAISLTVLAQATAALTDKATPDNVIDRLYRRNVFLFMDYFVNIAPISENCHNSQKTGLFR